jgi:hypothetical protein
MNMLCIIFVGCVFVELMFFFVGYVFIKSMLLLLNLHSATCYCDEMVFKCCQNGAEMMQKL